MKNNPEFMKNLWLEFSLHRAIFGFVVIGLIFTAVHVSGENLFQIALTAGVVICGMWGTKNVADSIGDELRQKTWDFIRVSSIHPLKLVLGKVFGASSYAWFLTIPCLVIGYASVADYTSYNSSARSFYQNYTLEFMLYCVLLGICSHFLAYLMAVKSISKHSSTRKIGGLIITAVIICIAGKLFFSFISLDNNYSSSNPQNTLQWYGISIRTISFHFLDVAMLIFWALVGCYNLTKSELGYKVSNLSWAAFVLYAVFYINGYSNINEIYLGGTFSLPQSMNMFIAIGAIVSAALYYVMLLIERKDIITIKKMTELLRKRSFFGVSHYFPSWVITFNIFLIFIIGAMITNAGYAGFLFAVLLLVLRDSAIILYFNMSTSRRKEVTAIIYLTILYTLLPFLAESIYGKNAVSAFIPVVEPGTLSIVLIFMQTAVAAYFLYIRLVKNNIIRQ